MCMTPTYLPGKEEGRHKQQLDVGGRLALLGSRSSARRAGAAEPSLHSSAGRNWLCGPATGIDKS